ncbi:MAG: 2-oxoacid:acceptor oxidoreductase family protein [Caldilineales bacterium]|nr:2-oxoacid:acceptor oxidoreductase family protein [Caldilineales bacterium]
MTQAHTLLLQPIESYKNERPDPFCPGCGHTFILNHLDAALTKLQLDPRQVVLVSDIGCVGLSDQYFTTNAFHGLHGRSVAYATGIKLANPDLKVIVLMGDGGTGIGGTHIINAARRNVGVTVLVFNNFNFGMTGGEHSVTTPAGYVTASTRTGNLEGPLDVCASVAVNGAGYVYRGTSFDKDLPDRMAEAISYDGFSLLDIWELCTAYFVVNNDFGRKEMMGMLDGLGMQAGLIQRREVQEYARNLHKQAGFVAGKPALPIRGIEPQFSANLDRKFHLIIAGSAGAKVRSAAKAVGYAGVLSGLWATQSDDYPTTVKSGHSISEIVFSPEEIRYTGIAKPDALVLLSQDGLGKVRHHLARMTPDDVVITTPEFESLQTKARVVVLRPREGGVRITRTNRSLIVTAAALRLLDLFPITALEESICRFQGRFADENLPVVEASAGLLD